MEKLLEFLMSTNGILIIGIIWYLVKHFLGIEKTNKTKLEKWLMSTIIGAIAQQEVDKLGIAMPEINSVSDTKRNQGDIARGNAVNKIMSVVSATNKKDALKKIGIDITHEVAGIAIDRIIKSSKMGIKLKLRDLPFLKGVNWPRQ